MTAFVEFGVVVIVIVVVVSSVDVSVVKVFAEAFNRLVKIVVRGEKGPGAKRESKAEESVEVGGWSLGDS